jgi:hypothetical protein
MSRRIDAGQRRREGSGEGEWVSVDSPLNIRPCTAFKRYPCECLNPLCHIMLEGEGRDDRVYCSDRCRTVASILRRAGELLKGQSDAEVLRIIRSQA